MSAAVNGFDFNPRTRLVFGIGAVDRLGELCREYGAGRVLLVTDAGLVAAGHAEHAHQSLDAAGLESVVYDGVRENPTTRDVEACVEVARAASIDVIVGFGGGSSMDTAKGCNFVLTNGGRMRDYAGIGKARSPMLPLIAVPTTAGTGSECQSFALIADETTHQKMACGDPKAAPRIAVLDPALTVSQPRAVTAVTGIDAIAHAVETAVTKKRTEMSWLFSREAFRLTLRNFPRVLADPEDLEARAGMQLGSAYAGMAIENSMLGAAHSAANPLTAHFDLVHGHAVGIMLPAVVRFNAEDPSAREAYRQLAVEADLVERSASARDAAAALADHLEALLAGAGLAVSLRELGIPAGSVDELSEEAASQWTAAFNPRVVNVDAFRSLYQSVRPA